jgi:hypothetical protein
MMAFPNCIASGRRAAYVRSQRGTTDWTPHMFQAEPIIAPHVSSGGPRSRAGGARVGAGRPRKLPIPPCAVESGNHPVFVADTRRRPVFLPAWIDPPFVVAPRLVFHAPVAVPAPSPIGLLTLSTCQWLEGHPRDLAWCGASVAWPGCSWCEEHERIAYPNGRRPPM